MVTDIISRSILTEWISDSIFFKTRIFSGPGREEARMRQPSRMWDTHSLCHGTDLSSCFRVLLLVSILVDAGSKSSSPFSMYWNGTVLMTASTNTLISLGGSNQ